MAQSRENTLSISLPERQRAYVRTRITEGGYGSLSEYFRELVRKDQRERAREELEASLLSSLGTRRIRVTAGYWKGKRRQLERRVSPKSPR